MRALERLTKELMRQYDLTAKDVYLHRDLRQTACPGDRFPREAFYREINRRG